MDCCGHENMSKVIVGICVNLMSFLCSSTIFFSLGGGGGWVLQFGIPSVSDIVFLFFFFFSFQK